MFNDLISKASTIEEKAKEIDTNAKIKKLLDDGNRIWLGADWHLWKFKDEQVYRNPNSDEILKNYSEMVNPDDVFIFLGDLQHDEVNVNKCSGLANDLAELPGHKILVKGNNDVLGDDFYYDNGFDNVCDKFTYNNIIFTHAPIEREDFNGASKNFHGHIHFSKAYCVGYHNHADMYTPAHDNRPILMEDAIRKLKYGFYKPKPIA